MSLVTTGITNDTQFSKTRPYPTAVGARRDAFSDKVRETLGKNATLTPATSVNLDLRRGPAHSTTGIPYAIGGTATVVSQKVGLWLAGFDDPIKAILGVGVHKDEKIIIKRKFCVGGGATIVPERAPARTVAIQEDVREVTLTRYGGDIEMNLNLFLTDEAEEELNMKVDCQKRELEKQLVKIGYDTLMTEGTLIMDAIMRSSPSYSDLETNNKYAAHAQQIYSKQIFGAINKYRFPIANLLAAAKYASAYSIAQQKGSVMIIPHGVPELTTIARKEKMEYQVSGLQNNTKINMELDNVYTDPNSGVRILVHHATPSYENGAAAPIIDLASANLSDTSYVITKHQKLLKDNPTFLSDTAKCQAYCQDTVRKSLANAIVKTSADLSKADNLNTFRNQIEEAAGQVTEGLCGFNAKFGSTCLNSVPLSEFSLDAADVDKSFTAMQGKQSFAAKPLTKTAVASVYKYDPTFTAAGQEIDDLETAFVKALSCTRIDNTDPAKVSARQKIESLIACYATAYTFTPGIDLNTAFQRLQIFASFVADALPPGADPVGAFVTTPNASTIIGTGDTQKMSSYIVRNMAFSQYHDHVDQVRLGVKQAVSSLDTELDAWKTKLDGHYSGSGTAPDKTTQVEHITKMVKSLIAMLNFILGQTTSSLPGAGTSKLLQLPTTGTAKDRAIRIWNSYSVDGDPLVANVTFDHVSPKACVDIIDQNYVNPNTSYIQIPDIESGGLKAYTATTVIRVAKVIASSAILAAPGDSTGQLLVGYPFTGVSTSATEERMRVQLRCYLGAALYQPDAVMILPNVFVEGIENCMYFKLARAEYGQIVEQVLCQMQERAGAFDPKDNFQALELFKAAIKQAWIGHEQLLKCVEHLIQLFEQNSLPMYPQITNRAVIPDGTVYEGTNRVVSNAGEFGILDDPVKYVGLHGVPQAYEHGEF